MAYASCAFNLNEGAYLGLLGAVSKNKGINLGLDRDSDDTRTY